MLPKREQSGPRSQLIEGDISLQRLRALSAIAWHLFREAEQARHRGEPVELPAALEKRDRTLDPMTSQPYEYRRTSATTYELCAEFATDSAMHPFERSSGSELDQAWQHPSGRHCFEFDVLQEPPPLGT